jgi:hypothetical protein
MILSHLFYRIELAVIILILSTKPHCADMVPVCKESCFG